MAECVNGGLLVVGASRGCGKTVVTAGVAAALAGAGVRVQAYKPLVFSKATSLTAQSEQRFMNGVTGQYMTAESLCVEAPERVTPIEWTRLVETSSAFPYPVLLEGVAQVATPWAFVKRQLMDCVSLAQILDLPVLLVVSADATFFESVRSALAFLTTQGIKPIGFVRVATRPDAYADDWSALLVSQQYQVPFLGDFPYSPSISVLAEQQGNLIRLTEESIDLLPIQYAMGVHLA